MLDTRRMQLLRAVVTSGSVSVAAANLGYTPSAISQQLAVLEREAGVALLEKVGRGVRPTQAGSMVAERAAEIGRILGETTADLATYRDGCAGRLRIRWDCNTGAALVPPAVAAFRTASPDVRVEPCLSADPQRDVTDGEADIGVIALSPDAPPPEGVRVVHVLDEPFRVVLPAQHPLAAQEVVDLGQLAEEWWVSTTSDQDRDACHEVITSACGSAGFTPNIAVRADDFLIAQNFVSCGMGVRLAPRLGLHVGATPDLAVRPVRRPEPMLRVYLVVRDAVASNPLVTGMLDELCAAAGELESSVAAAQPA